MNGIHHSDRGDGNGTTLQDRPPGLNDGLCARPHFIDFVLLCDADREEMVRNDGVVGAYTKPCEGYSVPCDRPPDPPLSAAERALQEEEDEEANRRLAAYDILWEQADAIASSEQSTRRATVLRGIATMQPFVDRGEIRSSRIYEMFLTAAWDARGGYAYSACTACGSHPAQGMAWWLDTDDVDVVCDTCRTCARCDERGIRWLSDGENICETCRQRSMGYVSRTAASIHPEAVEWYYAGRVPLGALTLLVGPPGLGKTTFACELAARGSRGELVGAAADVIFATTEDSLAHTLVPRFTAADAGPRPGALHADSRSRLRGWAHAPGPPPSAARLGGKDRSEPDRPRPGGGASVPATLTHTKTIPLGGLSRRLRRSPRAQGQRFSASCISTSPLRPTC